MHITIDCRFVNHSGLGRYTRELVSRLVKNQQNKFTLIISKKEINDEFMQQCSLSNVVFRYCSAEMYSIKEQLQMPVIVPKCDIFWAPHYNAPILPLRAKKKIVTIHDMGHVAVIDGLSLIKRIYANLLMYTSTHFYNKIFTDSKFSKDEIVKYKNIPVNKIAIQYCAVDLVKYKKNRNIEHCQQIRGKYNLPEHYFLYVGNVKPHKNIIRLIKAYSYFLANSNNAVSLVIVGKKEGLLTGVKGLSELIRNLKLENSIVFTGFVSEEDLAGIYSMAEVFLFPSLYEGFGLPPLEAMACECPVIVSNAASLPEVCEDAVTYIDPLDEANIGRTMINFFERENNSINFVKRGLLQVGKYSWDKAVGEIENIFATM